MQDISPTNQIEGVDNVEWHNAKKEHSFNIDYRNQMEIYDDEQNFLEMLKSLKEHLNQKPHFAFLKSKGDGLDCGMELINVIDEEIPDLLFSFKAITKDKSSNYCTSDKELYQLASEKEILILETIIKMPRQQKQPKQPKQQKQRENQRHRKREEVVEESYDQYQDFQGTGEKMVIENVYSRQDLQREEVVPEEPKKKYRSRILGSSNRKQERDNGERKQSHKKPNDFKWQDNGKRKQSHKKPNDFKWQDNGEVNKNKQFNDGQQYNGKQNNRRKSTKQDNQKMFKAVDIRNKPKPVIMNYNQLNKNNMNGKKQTCQLDDQFINEISDSSNLVKDFDNMAVEDYMHCEKVDLDRFVESKQRKDSRRNQKVQNSNREEFPEKKKQFRQRILRKDS